MLTIERATETDLAALIDLDPIARRSADRREAIGEWIALGQCHTARLDARAAGYVAFTRTFFRSPFLEMLMVAETARRQGVGRALIVHCIGLVPAGEKMWTSTNESNTPMRVLLPTLGFVQTGQFDGLDDGDPELIYLRESGSRQ